MTRRDALDRATAALAGVALGDATGRPTQTLTGGPDAPPQFFAPRTPEPLGTKFLPIVPRATKKVALAEKYTALAGKA